MTKSNKPETPEEVLSKFGMDEILGISEATKSIKKLESLAMKKKVSDKVSSILPSQLAALIQKFMQSSMNIIAWLCQSIQNKAVLEDTFESIEVRLSACTNMIEAMQIIHESYQSIFSNKIDIRFIFDEKKIEGAGQMGLVINTLKDAIILENQRLNDANLIENTNTPDKQDITKLSDLIHFTGTPESETDFSETITPEGSDHVFFGPGMELQELSGELGISPDGSAILYKIPGLNISVVCASIDPLHYKDDLGTEVLRRAIRRTIRRLWAIWELETSHKDALTKLLNRQNAHLWFRELDKKMRMSDNRDMDARVVTAMIDIDFFKKVNDTHGHAKGDEVIREFAGCLKKYFKRNTDTVARWWGEEFLVVFIGTEKEAKERIEKVREEFSKIEFMGVNGLFSVTCSGGIFFSLLSDYSWNNDDINEKVGLADRALYRAKNDWRNRMQIYDPTIDNNISKK